MRPRLFVLAMLLGLLCSGCVEAPEPAEENLIVIGMSQVGAESDWRVANSESMKSVFTEENGYHLLFDDARQRQENQIMAVRKFIQQQVDYIVLMPISESGWEAVLQEAREAGIPVILVDRMVDVTDESLYTAHVGSDFLDEGRQAVAWLEDSYRNGTEEVYIIHVQGTYGSTAQLGRTAALEEALSRNENWTLMARLDGDFTQAKTYEVMTEYLSGLPQGQRIDVVYCENDNEAFGAIQALEEQGYPCGVDGVRIVTFDATRNALTACLDGKITLAVTCNPLLGPLTEEVIQIIQAGQTPQKHYYDKDQLFTAEDLTEEFIANREY